MQWWKLVAAGRLREALDLLPHDDSEVAWTPEHLERTIATYGAGKPHLGDPRWEAGSIFAQPDPGAIIRAIKVDRDEVDENDPAHLGIVHFEDVPWKSESAR